jgi:hypothetical protein
MMMQMPCTHGAGEVPTLKSLLNCYVGRYYNKHVTGYGDPEGVGVYHAFSVPMGPTPEEYQSLLIVQVNLILQNGNWISKIGSTGSM